MMDEEKEIILARLIEHFRLVPRHVTYMERVEMLFVFRFAARSTGGRELDIVLSEIDRLQQQAIWARSNRQKLHQLFALCQTRDIAECARYDTQTRKPPTVFPGHNDYEY